jgi:hypothetical protein
MQGAGTLCLQLLGFKDCREAKEGVKYVAKNVEVVWRDRERRDVAMHNHPCYGWYYQTQAMFHAGITVWPKWNGMFSSQLTRNQHSDGKISCFAKSESFPTENWVENLRR